MKFCKRYQEYMQGKEKELPAVGLKKLKKILKRCRRECPSRAAAGSRRNGEDGGALVAAAAGGGDGDGDGGSKCSDQCPVCDGTFFPSLMQEMSTVVGCFNERARKLLELHLASGFRKYFAWVKGKKRNSSGSLIQEGKDLVAYAIINSVAMRKILKKYDKIHYSKQGQAFRSQAQIMHIEILQSPWLCELIAFYINTRKDNDNPGALPGLFEDCSLTFDDDNKPTLSCGLFDSLKLSIDLTCSICLDTVFDTVSLSCGHIFCYMCACRAASVTIVDGLKSADPRAKCPLCRQTGVYGSAVHLDELNILLSKSCHEYWEQRLWSERVERVKQAKEHWEAECRSFVGF